MHVEAEASTLNDIVAVLGVLEQRESLRGLDRGHVESVYTGSPLTMTIMATTMEYGVVAVETTCREWATVRRESCGEEVGHDAGTKAVKLGLGTGSVMQEPLAPSRKVL